MKHYFAAIVATLLLSLSSSTVLAQEDAGDMDSHVAPVTVNVNQADAQTIAEVLLGVGLTRAQAIVDYREAHGPFYTVEELTAVKGIGPVTLDKNSARIELN